MDWLKKYLVFAFSLAVAFVLLAAAGARLFFVYKSYQNEKRELDNTKGRLDQLYHRDLFPSASNVAQEQERVNGLVDEHNEINSLLSAGQIQPAVMETYAFNVYLEKKIKSIKNNLVVGRVKFSKDDAFGFDKYTVGRLPSSKDIPRLVQQLLMIERICSILPEAGISELSSLTRDQFDASAISAEPQPGRQRSSQPSSPAGSLQPAESLYSTQHFKMVFLAKEGALLDFLNRLARLPMFTVVTWIEIKNPRLETSMAAVKSDEKTKTPAKTEQTTELSREQRIILGREDVEVGLEMDVYNFGPPMDFPESKAKKTDVKNVVKQ